MPQSLSFLLTHLIFSTKDREPFFDGNLLPEVHSYLATLVRDMGCDCFRVGGVSDHVHLAVGLTRTISVAQLIEKIKIDSSKWIKRRTPMLAGFSWQRGYGAFSVSPGNLDDLKKYIDDQASHHRTRTFQEEYRSFLEKYHIPYDERYVWD